MSSVLSKLYEQESEPFALFRLFFSGSVLIGVGIAYYGVEKKDFEETIVAAFLIWTTAILIIMICVDVCMRENKNSESLALAINASNVPQKVSYEP